jgi:hypothetical protein
MTIPFVALDNPIEGDDRNDGPNTFKEKKIETRVIEIVPSGQLVELLGMMMKVRKKSKKQSESLKINKSLQAFSFCGNCGWDARESWNSSKKVREGDRLKKLGVHQEHPFEQVYVVVLPIIITIPFWSRISAELV